MFILGGTSSRSRRLAACLAVILSVTFPPSDAIASTEGFPEQAVVGPWRAAYLPHGWIATPRPGEQITVAVRELSRMAMNTQIHNIGAMDATGSVPSDEYFGLAQWIDVSRQVEPDHEIILWISGDTATHVSDAALHGSIATWLASLVGSHEVDGLFLDLEPFGADDPNLVALLRTIDDRLPDTWIGLAAPGDDRWSDDYIQTLSTTVDGLSSLLYDTSISDIAEYRDRVAVEVARYQQAAGGRALVVPSLPSYQANTWHDPAVENIAEAMKALRSLDQPADGAAIYWWWEFDDDSRRSWLQAVETGSDSAAGFSDVGEDNPHRADIVDIAARGITRGCDPPSNDRFCPDRRVTRGDMSALLHRAFPELSAEAVPAPTDSVDSVFVDDIRWMLGSGISRGCNPPANDRYCANEPVTRGQMATFLARILGLPAASPSFQDVAESPFRQDIWRLAAAGLTTGCNPPDNTEFCPDDHLSRAQLATFLARALASRGPVQ